MTASVLSSNALSIPIRDFFRAVERNGSMAFLHAYFDDSSDDKRQRFMAVGGLIGADEQFTDLDIRWCHETFGLKEPFRSTDCETQNGQFTGWSKSDCDALMKRLVEAVLRSGLLIYGSIVPVMEYRNVFPGAREYDPYFLALRHTLINMAFIASRAVIPVDIRVCCEESKTTSGRAREIYQGLKGFSGWNWGRSLAGFSTATKKLMALQAADMMAREAFKHAENLGVRKTRKPIKTLHEKVHLHLWTKETLEYLRDNGGAGSLHALTHWGESSAPPNMRVFYKSSFDLS